MPPDAAGDDAGGRGAAAALRAWLIAGGAADAAAGAAAVDAFDRHVFASVLALAATEAGRPLAAATGLAAADLARVCRRFFPHAEAWLAARLAAAPATTESDGDDAAIEEPDLVRLLLAHRSRGAGIEADWLARILARRSLAANHLWQDLGLAGRGELGRLMRRHFAPLARRNAGDMKWKKFFYRTLCEADGVLVCKAPNCAVCGDHPACFGDEPGAPLVPSPL